MARGRSVSRFVRLIDYARKTHLSESMNACHNNAESVCCCMASGSDLDTQPESEEYLGLRFSDLIDICVLVNSEQQPNLNKPNVGNAASFYYYALNIGTTYF
jgi:hypothetical protein